VREWEGKYKGGRELPLQGDKNSFLELGVREKVKASAGTPIGNGRDDGRGSKT